MTQMRNQGSACDVDSAALKAYGYCRRCEDGKDRVARILPDKDIKRLIGRVLIDADEKLLNPNGIELRLGDRSVSLNR